jgi:hypothetical protein
MIVVTCRSGFSGAKLCVKFDTGPYTLHSLTLTCRSVYQIDGSTNTSVVVGQTKTVQLNGVGLQTGDKARFVAVVQGSDQDCNVEPPGGTGDLTVTAASVDLNFVFAGSWSLCYQFGASSNPNAPWVLFQKLTVAACRVAAVDTTSYILGSSADIIMQGTNLLAGDIAKWVDTLARLDSDCLTLPSLGNSTAIDDRGNVRFASPAFVSTGLNMVLCYQRQGNPFRAYPNFLLSVFGVSNVNTNNAVVGAARAISITGTGIALGNDFVKWVSASATGCLSVGLDALGGIPEQPVQCGGRLSTTFLTAGDGMKWKTCYKFGSLPYVLYPHFTMQMMDLTAVSLNTVVVGDPRTILFSVVNLPVNSTYVKWVSSSSVSDSDCGLPSQGGVGLVQLQTTGVPHTKMTANLTFTAPALGLKLCYRAGNETFRLLESMRLSIYAVWGHSMS